MSDFAIPAKNDGSGTGWRVSLMVHLNGVKQLKEAVLFSEKWKQKLETPKLQKRCTVKIGNKDSARRR